MAIARSSDAARVVARTLFTPPEHARQHAVRMRDGVLLATDVYLPANKRGPVLLARLPYDKAGDECFMPAIAAWFTERGYAVVVQDVRGKGRSGGEFDAFVNEVDDGFDTLEWITRQDWASGRIGMFGDSYYGFTQWAAVACGHPALAAIAPRVTTPDPSHIVSGGVFRLEMAIAWVLETFLDERLFDCRGDIDWTVRPQADIAAAVLDGRHPPVLDEWARGTVPPALGTPGTVPALHLVGLDDFLAGAGLTAWAHASSGPAEQQLLIDARDHAWTARETAAPGAAAVPEGDPHPAFLEEYLGPLLTFFDRHLGAALVLDEPRRTAAAAATAPVRWRIDDGAFHAWAKWPPAEVQARAWVLTVDGGLDGEAGAGVVQPELDSPGVRGFVHDPASPVPSAGNPFFPNLDRTDESRLLERDDVLTFTSCVMSRPLILLGAGALDLVLDIDAPAGDSGTIGHVMVELLDVGPDGSAAAITEAATAVDAGDDRIRVALPAVGWELPAGHRLSLALSASSHPRYLLHPGTAEDPWTARGGERRAYRVHLGGESRLEVDVRGDGR